MFLTFAVKSDGSGTFVSVAILSRLAKLGCIWTSLQLLVGMASNTYPRECMQYCTSGTSKPGMMGTSMPRFAQSAEKLKKSSARKMTWVMTKSAPAATWAKRSKRLSPYSRLGSCPKRQKPQAPTPQAPIRSRQTRKVANAKGLNRNTNLT